MSSLEATSDRMNVNGNGNKVSTSDTVVSNSKVSSIAKKMVDLAVNSDSLQRCLGACSSAAASSTLDTREPMKKSKTNAANGTNSHARTPAATSASSDVTQLATALADANNIRSHVSTPRSSVQDVSEEPEMPIVTDGPHRPSGIGNETSSKKENINSPPSDSSKQTAPFGHQMGWSDAHCNFARQCIIERYDELNGGMDPNHSEQGSASTSLPRMQQLSPKRKNGTAGKSQRQKFSGTIEKTNEPVPSPSWSPITASKFQVRAGPNYKKNKRKASSMEALYEPFHVRMFTSKKGTNHICNILPMPAPEATDGFPSRTLFGDKTPEVDTAVPDVLDTAVPDVLVLHVRMPKDPPSMFNATEDGRGQEMAIYLKPSERFVNEVTGCVPMTAATSLFVKWCKTADFDSAMRSRFKCMALVRNLDAHNLAWIKPYNGKPVLITESGTFRKGFQDGVRFAEMSANIHKWSFVAKKGFVTMLPKFKELRLDVGFTIEGEIDAELPECILGGIAANFMSEEALVQIPPGIQEHAN